jgi:hypothetical protein
VCHPKDTDENAPQGRRVPSVREGGGGATGDPFPAPSADHAWSLMRPGPALQSGHGIRGAPHWQARGEGKQSEGKSGCASQTQYVSSQRAASISAGSPRTRVTNLCGSGFVALCELQRRPLPYELGRGHESSYRKRCSNPVSPQAFGAPAPRISSGSSIVAPNTRLQEILRSDAVLI